MEGARLGRNGSATREGLHLRPQEQGQIGRGDREKGVQRCRELFEKHFEKKKPEARQR